MSIKEAERAIALDFLPTFLPLCISGFASLSLFLSGDSEKILQSLPAPASWHVEVGNFSEVQYSVFLYLLLR